MPIQTELLEWSSGQEAHEVAARWDELFERSAARLPTSRFDHLSHWFDQFSSDSKRWMLVALDGNRWLAAIPLLQKKWMKLFCSWEVPYSYWTPSPEILIDQQEGKNQELGQALFRGLQLSGRPLWRAGELHGNNPICGLFRDVWNEAGLAHDWTERYQIGEVLIRGDGAPESWDEFQMRLSGNFRRQMRKMMRRAESLGGVELVVERPTLETQVREQLHRGFEIEDRGWKGEAASSVLKAPGMFEFFCRQGAMLARRGELVLLTLNHQGQSIAFEYGWLRGRTYFSPKIAYDETASHLSPGHLLMHLWIEQMFAGDEVDQFDFCGPLAEATSRWQPRPYPVFRFWAANNRLGSGLLRSALGLRAGKQKLSEWKEQWKRQKEAEPALATHS